jgi:Flp pilus assembly pilin Flp
MMQRIQQQNFGGAKVTYVVLAVIVAVLLVALVAVRRRRA